MTFRPTVKSLILALILLLSPGLTSSSHATDSTEACDTIHRYESFCWNLELDACIQYRQGFDYWHNTDHQKAWDDFYNLCGQDQNQHSHSCIALLGIEASCTSTVPAPLEAVQAYPRQEEVFVSQPREQAVPYHNEEVFVSQPREQAVPYHNAETSRFCYTSETYEIFDRYYQICGNKTAASCEVRGENVENYKRVCGDKSPCECASSSACGRDYCATPVATPEEPRIPIDPRTPDDPRTPAEEAVPRTEVTEEVPGSNPAPAAGEILVDAKTPNYQTPLSKEPSFHSEDTKTALPSAGLAAVSGSGCSLSETASGLDGLSWFLVGCLPLLTLLRRKASPV